MTRTSPHAHAVLAAFAALVLVASTALAVSPNIVISQVYGGAGCSSAGCSTYKNDYLELFNRSASSVNVNGWSVQYASATGTSWQVTPLGNVSIPAGGYCLVAEGSGANGVNNLPTPDVTGTIAMSATAAKVALVNSTTALSGACPASPSIVDLVGYGTTANCNEGGANAPAPSTANADFRASGGCTDTDHNNTDFTAAAASPRNSASAANVCAASTNPSGAGAAAPSAVVAGESTLLTVAVTPGANPASTGLAVTCDATAIGGSSAQSLYDDGTNGDLAAGDGTFSFSAPVAGGTSSGAKTLPCTISDAQGRSGAANIALNVVTLVKIHDIQGNGAPSWDSPYAGQTLTTRGVVTALLSNAFFIEEPDATQDADPATSEGLYVYAAPPVGLARGDLATVTGVIADYRPAAEPLQPAVTELGSVSAISRFSSGNPLPTPVTLTSADTNPAGGFFQLAKYDGMRVSIPSMTVVGPTGGSMSDTTGQSTTNGFYWGVVTGIARPFREVGANVLDPLSDCSGTCVPANVPRFDGNPERFDVGSKSQVGAASLEVRAGDVVTGQVGPLIFNTSAGYRAWEFFPDGGSGTVSTAGPGPTPVSSAAANEFTVASFNMQHFFASSFPNRGTKALAAIRDYLHTPDILAVAEVDTLATLQALRDLVNNDAAGSHPAYEAYLVEGNDISGIDVGFLVKTAPVAGSTPRVSVASVVQEGRDTLLTNPDSTTEPLNDRPPLRLTATVNHANGASFAVTVIAVHQKALSSVDSTSPGDNGWPTLGARNRAKREQQAEFLADLVQLHQAVPNNERVVVLGDFNAFEFNDGFVDVMGASTGNPVPADQVELGSPDLLTPNLTVLQAADAAQRYSYSDSGNAQNLDQMAVGASLLASAAVRLEHARIDADFPDSDRNDAASPRRVSDHDPLVGFFAVPAFATADLSAAISGAPPQAPPGGDVVYTVTVANAGPDPASGVVLADTLPAGTTFQALSAPGGWGCTTPAVGAGGTITCSISALAVTSAAFDVTVRIVAGTPLGTELYHDASVSAASTDPALGDNDAGATTVAAAGAAAQIAATGGTPQHARLGTAFAQPLQAIVHDAFGNPVPGVDVTFTAPTTGASGAFPGPSPTAVVATGADGVATSPTIVANSVLGGFTVAATVSGVATSAPFALSNDAQEPIPALGTVGVAMLALLLAGLGAALLGRAKW